MTIHSWLRRFETRLRNSRRRRNPTRQPGSPRTISRIETYEDRTLLASQILFLAGHLQVFNDADESILIREDPAVAGQVAVHIAPRRQHHGPGAGGAPEGCRAREQLL